VNKIELKWLVRRYYLNVDADICCMFHLVNMCVVHTVSCTKMTESIEMQFEGKHVGPRNLVLDWV